MTELTEKVFKLMSANQFGTNNSATLIFKKFGLEEVIDEFANQDINLSLQLHKVLTKLMQIKNPTDDLKVALEKFKTAMYNVMLDRQQSIKNNRLDTAFITLVEDTQSVHKIKINIQKGDNISQFVRKLEEVTKVDNDPKNKRCIEFARNIVVDLNHFSAEGKTPSVKWLAESKENFQQVKNEYNKAPNTLFNKIASVIKGLFNYLNKTINPFRTTLNALRQKTEPTEKNSSKAPVSDSNHFKP